MHSPFLAAPLASRSSQRIRPIWRKEYARSVMALAEASALQVARRDTFAGRAGPIGNFRAAALSLGTERAHCCVERGRLSAIAPSTRAKRLRAARQRRQGAGRGRATSPGKLSPAVLVFRHEPALHAS